MRKLLPLLLVIFAAGCAPLDRGAMSKFEPVNDATFHYEATADLFYPVDSKAAEADRMQWLSTYLRDNHLCPNGYKITSRKTVVIPHGHQIYYDGVCT